MMNSSLTPVRITHEREYVNLFRSEETSTLAAIRLIPLLPCKKRLHGAFRYMQSDLEIDTDFLTSEAEDYTRGTIEELATISRRASAVAAYNSANLQEITHSDHAGKSLPKVQFTHHRSQAKISPFAEKRRVVKRAKKTRNSRKRKQETEWEPSAHSQRKSKVTSAKLSEILRSTRGCWTCRIRHKACPEDGFPCSACIRLGLECDISESRPSYMLDQKLTAHRLGQIRQVTDKLRGRYKRKPKGARGRRKIAEQ